MFDHLAIFSLFFSSLYSAVYSLWAAFVRSRRLIFLIDYLLEGLQTSCFSMIFHSDNSHKDSGLQYLCAVSDSMNILWVAATAKEVSLSGLADPAGDGYFPEALGQGESLLVAGVGMVATAFSLGQILSKRPFDLVVNFGLAVSLSSTIHPVDLVEVT